jgi:hypothetical protein
MSKELKMRVAAGKGSLREVYWEGGGEVPQALKGLYTSVQDAQVDINKYLSTKETVKDEPKHSKRRTKEF